jgi:class 3 adenylate cyclase
MTDKKMRFRMDFVQEIVSIDEQTRTATFRLIPDPKRYEWKEGSEGRYLYDKLDNAIIPEAVFSEAIKSIKGMPIYYQPQKIGDAEQYVKSRIPFIQDRLLGKTGATSLADKSEEFLQSLPVNELSFVIMCVDIAGSTRLATTIPAEQYANLISTVLYEISAIIPHFHGHVLKYTGDGLIAYFPEPSFIVKNDLALDCALTVKRLVYEGLNPILKQNGYPDIDIRAGLDSGEAYIVTMGSPNTKSHKDIIGSIVSLAAKVQHLGKSGDILMGEVTERNLHTNWREICSEVKLENDWQYKNAEGAPYKVYKLNS